MSTTTEYLDRVKKKYNLDNNNQLATLLNQYLDTTRQKINNYYNQGQQLDMNMTFLVADLLDIESDEIIVKMAREKAKSGKNKEFWEKKLKDITPCILYSFLGVMSYFTSMKDYILC